MNPWGIVIIFAGFLMMYIGIKNTQTNVVNMFRTNPPATSTSSTSTSTQGVTLA